MPAFSPKFFAVMLASATILLLPEPLAAQSTANGRPLSSRPSSLPRQGLPPATMFDSTGRSPGSLSPRTATPKAPLILNPAKRTEPVVDLNGRLPVLPRERVGDGAAEE